MNALPANLPSIATARLPVNYEAAKNALAECSRIDECQEWADKAEVLASYAKQADDDTMRKMCDRIQARAVRRCAELLDQWPIGKGGDRQSDAAVPLLSRKQAALDAGLSERQYKTTQAVGKIPAEEFERQVESPEPPTVTNLAKQATKSRPLVDLDGRDPADFAASTNGQGHLRRFAEFCRQTDAAVVARGALPHECAAIREHIAVVDGWLDQLITRLGD